MCNLHLDEKNCQHFKTGLSNTGKKERFYGFRQKSVKKNSKINKDLELFILGNEFIIVHVGNFYNIYNLLVSEL